MVKRSYRRRPRTNRKRRAYRKRKWTSRIKSGVHFFKRRMVSAFNVYDTATPVHYAWPFSLSSLPNYTEFVNLYESYKISRIKVKFIFSANSNNVSTAATTVCLPNIYAVVDNNDSTALTNITDYLQYRYCKIRRLDSPTSLYLKPSFDVAAYSGVFTSYAQKTGWVDTDSPSVLHYGIKFAIDPVTYSAGTNVIGRVQAIVTYYLQMKRTH